MDLEYGILLDGRYILVEKECYQSYYQLARREKYLMEADMKHGLLYYNAWDTPDYQGIDLIADPTLNPEERILQAETEDTLRVGLSTLQEEERFLLQLLFAEKKSEREAAEILFVSQGAVHKKKHRILKKLKKFFEIT